MKPFRSTTRRHLGLNASGPVTALSPGELRVARNVDLYAGAENDRIDTRRGSALLSGQSYPAAAVRNTITYPVGTDEYLISHVGARLYAQKIAPTAGAPAIIYAQVPTIAGDLVGGLGEIVLKGLTTANTDGMKLYAGVGDGGGNYGIVFYKGAGSTMPVASGAIPNTTPLPATIPITAVGGSGITGAVELLADPSTTAQEGTVSWPEWDVGGAANDLTRANQKLFCFAQAGNSVVAWSAAEARFVARPMGMSPPVITSISRGAGAVRYYYGVETVAMRDGFPIRGSSPNRKMNSGELAASTMPYGGQFSLESVNLAADPHWTHVRVWRSKSVISDQSDPLAPVDAMGLPTELFELALITRAELYASTPSAIATGPSLPAGNAEVTAGLYGGSFYIIDTNDDAVLSVMVELDQIDLVPLPPARTGAVHAGRIFVSGINQADIDSDLAEDVLYTTEVYSAYAEQWDPQAFLNAGRNSSLTTKLLSLNDDLLVFREGETKRLPGGIPDAGIQMLDERIGIASSRMAGYVPDLGVAAICSDRRFRYLGPDLRWHSRVGDRDVSDAVLPYTSLPTVTGASFAYLNGKLLMLLVNTGGQQDHHVYALHVQEGRGWTEYDYALNRLVALVTFADGYRCAAVRYNAPLLEIEVGTDTDWDGANLEPVAARVEIAALNGDGGLVEVSKVAWWGKFSRAPSLTARSSGTVWSVMPVDRQPALWDADTAQTEREYTFTPRPKNVGPWKWVPLRGVFITLTLDFAGAASLTWCVVDGVTRPAAAGLDVLGTAGILPLGSAWNNAELVRLNFEDPALVGFADASGNQRDHYWGDNGYDDANRVVQKPGHGVRITPPSFGSPGTLIGAVPAAALVGQKTLTWKVVFSFSSGQIRIGNRTGGTHAWQFRLGTSVCRLDVFAPGTARRYQFSPTSDIGYYGLAANTVYVMTCVLRPDLTVSWWVDPIDADTFVRQRTLVASSAPAISIDEEHKIAVWQEGTLPRAVLSYYSIAATDTRAEQAERFWGAVKAY